MVTKFRVLSLFLSCSLFLSPNLMAAVAVAAQPAAPGASGALVEDYESGKARVTRIMTNEETGIAVFNKQHLHYAETKNLAADLNIPEMAQFFGCKTLIGLSYMTDMLQFPLLAQDRDAVIGARQRAIRSLVENPALKQEVEQVLAVAQEAEQDVVKLMSDFFIGKTCPELQQLEILKQQNPAIYPLFNFLTTHQTGKTVATTLNTVGLVSSAVFITLLHRQALQGNSRAALYCGLYTMMGSLYAYTAYKDYSTAAEKRSKMHALNQLIESAEKLESICKKADIPTQFKISALKDGVGRELIERLKHDRYAQKDLYLFWMPAVHAFLYEIYKQEKNLAQVFAAIAELDAYNALATKLLESQKSSSNKFCFATFIEQPKPHVAAHGFWNVLVKNAVPNSLVQDKHIILTGPNAGGKTTAIKAILQNIVLAQTFGIAAAERFELTMFDVIHSYLNISDDLINGLSLFASEVKRAQEILQKIKSLKSDEKFFFALDELFTGTAAEDGEICAERFMQNIAESDRILFSYATHFNKLKELGKNAAHFENYKVDAPTKTAFGKLLYPFTMSKGASDSRVAMELAQLAGLFN